MKKNLVYLMTVAVALTATLVACKKDKGETNNIINEVKKIPKTSGGAIYYYDDQNRLFKMEYDYYGRHVTETITYNPDGTIANYANDYNAVKNFTYEYRKDSIFVTYINYEFRDTLIINDKGQLLREHKYGMSYEYNSAGDITKIILSTDICNVTQSNIWSNWRYVNIPEWFYTVYGNVGLSNPEESKNGKKPLESKWSDGRLYRKYTYEVDADGYVQKTTMEDGSGNVYEWTTEYDVIE